MRYTKAKKRRMRKRMIKRMMQKCTLYIVGILMLVGVWKITSFAIHHLTSNPETEIEEQEEEAESVWFGMEGSASPVQKEDILLVNKDHPLDDYYHPTLKKMRDYGVEVDESIYDALSDMLNAGKKEGLSFWIASGYRSPERQRELLDEDIETLIRQGYSYSKAYEEVVRETMPVGCSEHATGLCVDIVSKNYQILDSKQAKTQESKWLRENCAQYGFILRYPEGKEDITGVSYESWHFRYVGTAAAGEIMEQGITLEEYLEQD